MKTNPLRKYWQTNKTLHKVRKSLVSLKTNYGFETGNYVVAKRRRLIRSMYFLTTDGDIKRYHRLRTVISLVSWFFLMLCACWEANEIRR